MKDPTLQPLWKRVFGNKLGCLFQGIRDIPGTDTCFFVELTNIPKDIKITYGKFFCDYKPHKIEKERVRLTVGGRHVRLLWRCRNFHGGNHNIQNPHQQHPFHRRRSNDDDGHKSYYVGTPLPRFEYMKMLLSRFPEEIVDKYNLVSLAVDGWFYIKIKKGMYGLRQAGLLANQML
jgi:hypothetical protein